MFKNPTCPYCNTVYRYKDTVNAVIKKKDVCYHCEKRFKISYKIQLLCLILLAAIVSVFLNILLLSKMTYLNLAALFIPTVFLIILISLLLPFFVKFKNTEIKNKVKNKK